MGEKSQIKNTRKKILTLQMSGTILNLKRLNKNIEVQKWQANFFINSREKFLSKKQQREITCIKNCKNPIIRAISSGDDHPMVERCGVICIWYEEGDCRRRKLICGAVKLLYVQRIVLSAVDLIDVNRELQLIPFKKNPEKRVRVNVSDTVSRHPHFLQHKNSLK